MVDLEYKHCQYTSKHHTSTNHSRNDYVLETQTMLIVQQIALDSK